jgi:hypothetical protein
MLDTLQALVDDGISDDTLDSVLSELLANGAIADDDDRRACAGLAWYRACEHRVAPIDCTVENDDTVCIDGAEYRVLTDDEADAACADHIKETLWAFRSGFLASETGIDESVFADLVDQCENSNDDVRALVDGSCGIDSFVESAVESDGRGHFLSGYDSEENEFRTDCGDYYYLYRVN